MNKEKLVYMILVEEDIGSDDYSDEEFIETAKQRSSVYTLKEFQDLFNYDYTIDLENYYIRII